MVMGSRMPIAMLSKLTALRVELGTVDALLYVVDRALRLLSGSRASLSHIYLMAQHVRNDPLLPNGRGSSIIIREATIDDVEREDWACGRDVARTRLGLGMVGLLATLHGRCIGYIWISLGVYQDELLPIELVPAPANTSAWSLDLFIHPDHRRSFAFARLWAAVFAQMQPAPAGVDDERHLGDQPTVDSLTREPGSRLCR